MRRFLLILFPAVLMFTSIFTSCIKNLEDEGIYVTTRCYGIVYDQQTMQPIPGIMIASTDGKKIEEKVYTQDDGSFSINISLEQLHRGCYLSVLPDSLYQTLDIKLDGMPLGLQNYDLGSIVIEGPSEPIIYTDNVTDITINSAHCYGEILEDGHSAITERGFVYAEVQYPTVEDNKVVVETANKTFDAILSLKPNTTYYVRAFARNGLGLSYGDQIEFSTLSGLPEVTTNGVYNITSTTAVCAANVNGNDMFPDTYRGVCWSTMPDPDINNTHTLEGYGSGNYNCTLTNLQPGTSYYVRAYAGNSIGVAYGEQIIFTTLDGLPTVSTTTVTNISTTTATAGGRVSNDGGFTVTQRGVCFSTSPYPQVTDMHTTDGAGTGTFVSYLSGLTPGTTYYYRAYATNAIGTVYGEQSVFVTH